MTARVCPQSRLGSRHGQEVARSPRRVNAASKGLAHKCQTDAAGSTEPTSVEAGRQRYQQSRRVISYTRGVDASAARQARGKGGQQQEGTRQKDATQSNA